MEGVRLACTVSRRIGQRLDDLQLFDDRAGPPMGDDERQRILVRGANVKEVDVEPIYLGDEVRLGIQSPFAGSPVVLARPIAGELLHERKRHTLRVVSDGLALRPPRRVDPPSQLRQVRLRKAHLERTNG